MNWNVAFLPEAKKDLLKLDNSNRILVRKAIHKVSTNPVAVHDGGYGHPLANLNNTKLAGFFKIKLRASGIRIVYKLIQQDDKMLIVIIGARADNEVYQLAEKRIKKNNLKD